MKKSTHNEPARVQFGKRLKQYRLIYKLPKSKFAEAMGTHSAYIAKVEAGELNIGIDNIEKYANFFDVMYYEMVNPYFPLPKADHLPATIRDIKDRVKKYKANRPKNPRIKLAPFVDELLKTKFLKKPRTLTEIANALKNKIEVPTNKIAVLLGQSPRNKIVRTIPGEEWGGKVNKYVLI